MSTIGGAFQEDVLDAGLPVHRATGGDISKCPYYAAKMTASSRMAYASPLAMAVLQHPTGKGHNSCFALIKIPLIRTHEFGPSSCVHSGPGSVVAWGWIIPVAQGAHFSALVQA
ncbi:unnamed protein product [Pleuronectes platessa]|uniref:Uncharacterized protein n=1 Tax=Pleuronectes platessa TaxID=8262 RepID=A0A9N7YE75_PLEPL|nr:unnamed protein product [Pleuronectes platessa]